MSNKEYNQELREAAIIVAEETLSRTRVFSDRKFTEFRNKAFNKWMANNKRGIKYYTDYVLENFEVYESVCRDVFNEWENKRTIKIKSK